MARAKKKLLPKNFEELLKGGELASLQAVFESCDVNARGGYSKQTALAYSECPDALAVWLIHNGADVQAPDSRGQTPLHTRARHWRSNVDVLLDLGADVNSPGGSIGTPLHAAADSHKDANVRSLVARGGNVNALNPEGLTPLELALRSCSNIDLQAMESMTHVLLGAGARKTDKMAAYVERIGLNFEFHRSSFNPESVGAASVALEGLYGLLGVPPVPQRAMHDGVSPIAVKSTTWPAQHQELWELLVPSRGHAATIQGEVVRISGRIAREIDGNGGANWDDDYRRMADSFLQYLTGGAALSTVDLALAAAIVSDLKRQSGDTKQMCELAVKWTLLNRDPIPLPPPSYHR